MKTKFIKTIPILFISILYFLMPYTMAAIPEKVSVDRSEMCIDNISLIDNTYMESKKDYFIECILKSNTVCARSKELLCRLKNYSSIIILSKYLRDEEDNALIRIWVPYYPEKEIAKNRFFAGELLSFSVSYFN